MVVMALECPPHQDFVIAGATGDLARRKLLPALFDLHLRGLLPSGDIIGYARKELTHEGFVSMAREAVERRSGTPDEREWEAFSRRLHYVSTKVGLAEVVRHCTRKERIVYFSTPPSAFPGLIRQLGDHGLAAGTRLIVEKPIGHDLASARELEDLLHATFDESQVFRIDHFLGKETVQNILVLRFANSIFERIWSRDAIDHMEITIAEDLGMEGRGAFYEETGAIRDIIQNHAFQVLALLTMEPPASFFGEDIRNEKVKLFRSIHPVQPADVVRGQYTAGHIGGKPVPGYREEDNVAPDSNVETYAAVRLKIDNWRWSGVPVFLRTGKRMERTATEIAIVFKDAPVNFFRAIGMGTLEPNVLTLRIQPEENITLRFLAKVPGPDIRSQPVDMEFSYGDSFMHEPLEAYERLLHDAMCGDHTLFARSDAVLRCWEVLQPLLDSPPPVHFYPAGSWGPREADDLIAPRTWQLP